jgi:hypothetical protein
MKDFFDPLKNKIEGEEDSAVTIPEEQESREKQIEIYNSTDFGEAIAQGAYNLAEVWLNDVKKSPYNYPDYLEEDRYKRIVDHREAELYRAYRDSGDIESADRIAQNSIKPGSREGRLSNLEQYGK